MEKQITNPIKAIRAKCLDCVCWETQEVKLCEAKDCPLHPFRMGKNPFRTKREYTDEQKEEMRDRLAKAREAKEL